MSGIQSEPALSKTSVEEVEGETATVTVGARVVRVSFSSYDAYGDNRPEHHVAQLDGSECVEIFGDPADAPEGAIPAEGWEGCLSAPALLDDREREAVEDALTEWVQDDMRDAQVARDEHAAECAADLWGW